MEFITDHKSFFSAAIVIIVAIVASRIIRRLLKRFFDQSSEHLNVDPTRYRFFRNMVDLLIFTLAGILVAYSIPALRTLGLTLFAGAGIIAAIVGFASQQAFSNIISGIFIVIFRPFRVNDIIKVGSFDSGIVEDITLRHTVIRSFENRRLVIPNAVISEQTVLNSSLVDEHVCMYIEVGISYESDVDKAIAIMQDECAKHPFCVDQRTVEQENTARPKVEVNVLNLTETAVVLRAGAWADDAIKGFQMKCDLLLTIKKRFDAEGIEFPFHYRTTVFKN
ncbi:MAG: mechanosensitive ion channel family protein [Bacteroidia bacterium]